MSAQIGPSIPFGAKVRYAMYGVVVGLLFGMVLGWIFHRAVGFIVTLVLVTPFIILLVLAFLYWRRVSNERAGPANDGVTDAQWRDVDQRPRS